MALCTSASPDLPGRIWQHRNKTAEGFTKRYSVDRLVWFEAHDSAESAIAQEKRLKRWRRQWKIELIEETNRAWKDLFDTLQPA